MRPMILAAALLVLAAPLAQAEGSPKKKKKNAYNAAEFIHKKEAKAPAVADAAKKDAAKADATTGGLNHYDCQAAETSPTTQQAVAEKPADKTKGEKPTVNSTEQALEMHLCQRQEGRTPGTRRHRRRKRHILSPIREGATVP